MATSSDTTALTLRPATIDDVPALLSLMSNSVSCLCATCHSPAQISAMIETLDGRYNDLIHDSSYLVICTDSYPKQIIASGGWNVSSPSSSVHCDPRSDVDAAESLNPGASTVQIRGIYVHPGWARRGLGTRLVMECEAAAQQRVGVSKFELNSTTNAVPLYESCGYVRYGEKRIALPEAEDLTVVLMHKQIQK